MGHLKPATELVSPAHPVVLGSGSPRRREILDQLGIPFVVHKAEANEDVRAGEAPSVYLERVVLAKLSEVARTVPADVAARAAAVLVADTSVIVDDSILGKPESPAHAASMLGTLAGRVHEVRTRFALARPTGELLFADTVVTAVHVRALSASEIAAYVATGEGVDKAGGYAVQGRGAAIVSRIEGSYTNVVGLPACELVVALARLGLRE